MFGISRAPEQFQRRMNELLTDLQGVLCQIDDILVFGKERAEHDQLLATCHILSRSMLETERWYAQVEKEALATTWACEKFADFLIGKHFIIETDHKPLVPLLGMTHYPLVFSGSAYTWTDSAMTSNISLEKNCTQLIHFPEPDL